MKKKLSYLAIFSILVILIPLLTYVIITSSVSQAFATQETVVYNLPYPGVLPDNPFYFLKIFRDRLTEFATRDNLKKADFFLITSDKRVAMAQDLAKKGRDKLAVETYTKAEKYFFQILPLLIESKKQGVSAPSSFIDTLKLSNAKHHEVGETLIKELPAGMNDSLIQALKINEELKARIEKL
jgi:hypothetical protein